MWNKAVEWGWPGISPVRGIKKFPEKARKRFLKPDEMEQFFQALAEEPSQTFAAFVLLCLFTGAREGNVLAMRWADVDLSDWMWSIPDTKNNEPQDVPLVQAVAEVLKRQREITDGEWVLPGRKLGTHLTGVRKHWSRLLRRSGITNLRIHDLRRSMASWGIREKVPLVLIKDILGHKTIDVTARVYALGDLTQVREAMTTITERMLEAGDKPDGATQD
jgi:integrase